MWHRLFLIPAFLLLLGSSSALASGPANIVVQPDVFVNFNNLNYVWASGTYGACYVGPSASNCTGVLTFGNQISTTTTTTAGGPPPPPPGGNGFFTTTVVNGQTTTVPLASSTGNPNLIPSGLLVIGAVLGLVFIPVFVGDRKKKGRTYTVRVGSEPRMALSGGREVRRKRPGFVRRRRS